MRNFALLAGGLAVARVAAHPLTSRQSANIDPVVLNFALTLEHLENAFYKQALTKFSLADFEAAGYSKSYYNNLKYIAYDEQSHVQLLTGALQAAGVTPVQPCTYNFPYTDVNSFITLSSVIEGVGTSAYLGGAPLITSKGYLTVAGSILVTEAIHTSYQRAAIGEIPMANAYGTPLDPTSVFTLAAGFIVSCPPGNPTLPFTPFPALTYNATGNCRCEEPDCAPSAAVKRDAMTPAESAWEDWGAHASAAAAETSSAAGGYGAGPSGSGYAPEHPKPTGEPAKPTGPPAKPTDSPAKPTGPPPAMTTECSSAEGGYGHGGYGSGSMVTVTKTVTAPSMPTGTMKAGSYCAPPAAGAKITFTAASHIPAGSYVTFISGLDVISVQGTITDATVSVQIPAKVEGQIYVVITSSDQKGTLDTTKVLFGPAIVEVFPAPPAIDFSQI